MDFGVFTRTWHGRLMGLFLLFLFTVACLGCLGVDLPNFLEGPR